MAVVIQELMQFSLLEQHGTRPVPSGIDAKEISARRFHADHHLWSGWTNAGIMNTDYFKRVYHACNYSFRKRAVSRRNAIVSSLSGESSIMSSYFIHPSSAACQSGPWVAAVLSLKVMFMHFSNAELKASKSVSERSDK